MDKVQKRKIVSVNFSCALFFTYDDLAMWGFMWVLMVQFRAIWFGMVQFSASYANLRLPYVFKLPNLMKKPRLAFE
jgi:hypothetical protein